MLYLKSFSPIKIRLWIIWKSCCKQFLFKIIWIPFFLFAQDVKQNSTFNVIKKTKTTNELIINPGAQVRALGVIDVPVELIASGKLFTFIYQDQVLNADFTNFEIFQPSKELGFTPLRSVESASGAGLC